MGLSGGRPFFLERGFGGGADRGAGQSAARPTLQAVQMADDFRDAADSLATPLADGTRLAGEC